jgi:hypothetical protein
VCHECYHAHQRRACDAYDTIPDEYKELLEFYDIQVYEREFSNYVSGPDHGEEYYNQLVERHARAYGPTSVEDYYVKLTNTWERYPKIQTNRSLRIEDSAPLQNHHYCGENY